MPSLVGALGAKYPDSAVLFDDTFEDGFAGWQELHPDPSSGPTFAPLSLAHPSVPGPCLATATRSATDPGIMSQGIAMKRITHMEPPAVVDFEVWFAWGGESPTGYSPKYIQFMIDEMYGGVRHFWKARWRNVNTITNTRTMDWFVASQAEDSYTATGFTSDLPWNGNKGSLCRVKLSIDLARRKYLALEANADRFDLSGVPGVTPPGNNGNATFDDPLFNNGLNFMVGVLNRDAVPLSAWIAVTRARASIRKA